MNIKLPKWLPKDKALHAIVGAMFGVWLILYLGMGILGWLICLALAFVVKELVYDLLLKKGNFEIMDAVWTMAFPSLFLIIHLISRL